MSQANEDKYVDTSDDINQAMFVNLAKSRGSPADIRSILSQASKPRKKVPTKTPEESYTVSFHSFSEPSSVKEPPFLNRDTLGVIMYFLASIFFFLMTMFSIPKNSVNPHEVYSHEVYQVSKHSVRSPRGAMVDRGANGGIAGNDCKIVELSGRRIDVTGINNHQISQIPVGTVAAHAVSQRGEVILIMHQYAIHQENRTIHSCVQLEHFGNMVEDRSLKAGGNQRLTTQDGYVFPIDIVQGLPYIKMRVPSDDEYATLPHVIMTADVPFKYGSMDCTLSDKIDWYESVSNWS